MGFTWQYTCFTCDLMCLTCDHMGFTWVLHGIHMQIYMKMFEKHISHVQSTRFTCGFHMFSHMTFQNLHVQNHMYM